MVKIGSKLSKIFLSILILLFAFAIFTFGQLRAEVFKVKDGNGKTEEVKNYDGSYALVIGVSDYTNGWQKLPGVQEDVFAVKSILEKHNFKVDLLMNPNKKQIIDAITSFKDKYGYAPNNRLLIYFAGHGETGTTADGRKLGYIIPVDAPANDGSSAEFKRKSVTMDEIRAFAIQIETKHVLFVFDSCFSGNLLDRNNIKLSPFVLSFYKQPVRQFLTSGAENQSVPDQSIFRRLFVSGLEGQADEDRDGVVLGSELARYVSRELTNSSNQTQTPQYGKIKDSRLNQGDIIFFVGKSTDGIPVIELAKSFVPNTTIQPKNSSNTFSVNKFTETKICPNAGENLAISADGIIILGANIKETGPQGKDTFQPLGSIPLFGSVPVAIDKKYYLDQSFPFGSLLCRFDYEDRWNYCSTSKTITAEMSGCLQFEINDKIKTDNTGAFQVTVKSL